ncbi:CMD domain protein [Neomegalonema perideroedes]|uniref:CMD domain protein n=1 Tax=Neomegalonema perideroedes TaxID=217219 RepID=UPI000380AFF8|nr:CMD domain protein [Neomegalonema perideroedes]
MTDLIDQWAGIAPGSKLDLLRAKRPQARASAQESYRLLLHPDQPGEFSLEDRHAVAAFVAGLHEEPETRAHYEALPGAGARLEAIRAAVAAGAAQGPYGAYPEGPLSAENLDGPEFAVPAEVAAALGAKLSRGLEHAHLLTFHPRDADPAALQRLLDAGWTPDSIVGLSQLVSFLAFQIRAVIGLRALAAA